ncbi:hypothetical protein [Photobacterium marinum]|uniref:hypothetical protein n=1 Tax=Photobacterium marinum TaxID=1056511 RepID=UPI00055EF7AE|nr:hypothetical protein [Photobacterium marinum]
MKKIVLVSMLLFTTQSLAANQEQYENRIARLEHRVRILTKQVHHLQQQIDESDEFQTGGDHMYQCHISAFGNKYIGRSSSRGRAVTEAVEGCNDAQDDIFCRPDSVKCVKY